MFNSMTMDFCDTLKKACRSVPVALGLMYFKMFLDVLFSPGQSIVSEI